MWKTKFETCIFKWDVGINSGGRSSHLPVKKEALKKASFKINYEM